MAKRASSRRDRAGRSLLLSTGQAVRIVEGAFRGYVGTIARVHEEGKRYVVNTSILHKSVAVEFPAPAIMPLHDQVHERQDFSGQSSVIQSVSAISSELIRQLSAQPDDLFMLSARKFEELVAELLDDMGYAVRLTPQTRDGGRDILAVLRTPVGELLTIVECKRFSPRRPVGVGIVRQFMWTVEQHDRASCGLVATTSRFSQGAKSLQREYRYRLSLRDKSGLQEWLARYGRWNKVDGGSLWLL